MYSCQLGSKYKDETNIQASQTTKYCFSFWNDTYRHFLIWRPDWHYEIFSTLNMVVITMIYKLILGLQPLWYTFGQVYTLKLLGYGTIVVMDEKCLLGLLRWSCNLCSDWMVAFWWSHHTTHQEVVSFLFYSLLFEYTITFLQPF